MARACIGLHVGRFPRPTAVLPLGGKPGETLDVQWLGDVAGPRTEKITLPGESTSLPLLARRFRHFRPRRTGHRAVGQSLSRDRSEQRAGSRAEQWPGRGHGLRSADRHERRDLAAGRHRLLQVPGQEGTGVRRPRVGPGVGSPLDAVVNVFRMGGAARGRQRRQRRPRQLSAIHRRPRTTPTWFTCRIT